MTNVFPNSTVLENVRVAEQAHSDDATTFWRNVDHYDEFTERAHEILDRVGLAHRAEDLASTLSHGAKRKLEVAIALAGDPAVLRWTSQTPASPRRASTNPGPHRSSGGGYPVLLVEHNMDIAMGGSDRVVVLHRVRSSPTAAS